MGAPGAQTVDTSERLAALRELMKQKDHAVTAYVVPSEDQHFSEYIAGCDERRAFISGFTGSAGLAIITQNDAYLYTDGRYFLQAEQQIDSNWTLMKMGLPDVPTWQDFLSKKLPKNGKIGLDPSVISAADAENIDKSLKEVDSTLVILSENLVDTVWGGQRPTRPVNKVISLDVKYAGQSHIDKLKAVREEVKKAGAKALVVSMLDEIAWLFNLRGSDIQYNPVFFAYAVITPDSAVLFMQPSQISDEVKAHLGGDVDIKEYNTFFEYLRALPSSLQLTKDSSEKVIIGDKASLAISTALGKDNVRIVPSPVAALKALKNETEVAGFRACHIRDGAALVRYFSWLEDSLNKREEISESAAADVLEKYRSEGELFQGLSFDTISSTGPNGAIIHYKPEPNDCAIIKKDQIYLCDSGGQYLDGTTDVTRTWHFGTPTEEERRAFTRVLQGHIAIDTAIFPTGTTGYVIDSWARRALWQDGLDYRHGTGHGVGHFLNVHEGPQGIGVRKVYDNVALKSGMTVSNEPGYYADGRFGIRIENVVVVRPAKTPNNFGDKGYLAFENFTMCPIHKKLVEPSLLAPAEREWLDDYHKEVLEKVAPLLKGRDDRALAWLKRECAPLEG